MIDSCETGKVVSRWETGDAECNAYSQRYECGGVYHHNFMDIVGNRDHDCFWDCRECKRGCSETVKNADGGDAE